MNEKIKELLKSLTLEEKASLCSGVGLWQTRPLEEKGIPEIWMADGSNGVRIMKPVNQERKQDTSDFLKVTDLTQNSPTITNQYEAVCYPSGASLASTWDTELIEEMGEALGTSIKHFAANNAETLRINMSSDVDERALREIYLAPFEIGVKNAKPWTVMSSYNKVNGVQMAENRELLTDILREEWGFDGVWSLYSRQRNRNVLRMKLILRTTGIYREKWRKNLLCF